MGRKSRAKMEGETDASPGRGLRRSIRRDARGQETPRRAHAGAAPPAIALRRLTSEVALARLELMLGIWRHKGQREVLVVHGRGRNSPGGQPILAPLVRQWCRDHPAIVETTREAPPEWGGEGALVVVLRAAR